MQDHWLAACTHGTWWQRVTMARRPMELCHYDAMTVIYRWWITAEKPQVIFILLIFLPLKTKPVCQRVETPSLIEPHFGYGEMVVPVGFPDSLLRCNWLCMGGASSVCHGLLNRYTKLRVARMRRECRERFSRHRGLATPSCMHVRDGHAVMHAGIAKYVMRVLWCMPGSLTSGFLWSRWQGKRPRYSRRMLNPHLCVSGKSPMGNLCLLCPQITDCH